MGGKKKAKALKEAQQKLMEESVRQSHERMQLAHHMVIIFNAKCYVYVKSSLSWLERRF
jgi:hypothetical protein